MTEQNKAESELDRLNGCAVALGFSDVSELVERTAKDRLLSLSRPTQTADAVEALDMARQLVQEAKSVDGPSGGYVTDHLDAAEGWLDKLAAALPQTATSEVTPTHDSGLAGELAAELDALITKSSGSANASMTKALEIANFVTQHDIEILTALRSPYIKPTPTPDSGLADKLNTRDLHFAIKALQMSEDDETRNRGYLIGSFFEKLTALQSNSDSELLREAIDEASDILAGARELGQGSVCASNAKGVLDDALARLEQGAA